MTFNAKKLSIFGDITTKKHRFLLNLKNLSEARPITCRMTKSSLHTAYKGKIP